MEGIVPRKNNTYQQGWLLFFYTVPSKPVSNRMKVWRKLLNAGAVPLKGAVYILPFNDELYDFLHWLVSEITGMKGEAAFVKILELDTIKNSEIIALFNRQRANDYNAVENALEDIEGRLSTVQKGGAGTIKVISDRIDRLRKDFDAINKIDFFSSDQGKSLAAKIMRIDAEIKKHLQTDSKKQRVAAITVHSIGDYRGKKWVTRKRPFVDRMASAWLIKKYIDKDAVFDFVDEKDIEMTCNNTIAFDVRGGEFTHSGNLCTFETLIKAFGLKDRALKKIAEIVHEIDLKDEKYRVPEAKGLEDILRGIRKTTMDDMDSLELGMTVFEMLYASKN